LIVNLVAFPLLWLLLLLRLRYYPSAVFAEISDHRRAPSLLTIVVGTSTLGNQVALLTAHRAVAAALWTVAAIIWIGFGYCPLALTKRPTKPPLEDGIDGSWLLIVVAPQALAMSAAHAAGALSRPEPLVLAGLCLFALGTAFYLILLTLIVHRWLFRPMRPEQFAPTYWINMGAAAITAVAGARLLPLVGADPVLQTARGFMVGEILVSWSLATWWIPLLCGLTLWRYRAGASLFDYRLDNWSIVFPLGMYAVATWHFARIVGLSYLELVSHAVFWVAVAAWCLTFAGMIRRFGGQFPPPDAAISPPGDGPD
jgi:tellurite resistance protein TehA-like permease